MIRSRTRTYEETHPWLTFRLDMQRAPVELWMLLGEARSKIEHIAESPLKPAMAKELHEVFLAKGILSTTAIEGNTLSEEDARRLVAGTLELPPSQRYLGDEMANIFDAFNRIAGGLLAGEDLRLDPPTLMEYNRLVLRGLQLEEGVVPGEIRTGSAVVGPYRAAPAEDCEYLLDRLWEWLEEGFEPPDPDFRLPWVVLKAIMAHLYFVWIHPFGDGNGRTARLMELQTLLVAGAPTPACHLLSNHYNLTRADYYRHLHLSSHVGEGDPIPFVTYAVRGFVDGLRDQLRTITNQQFTDRWEQYIYETFGDRRSPADQRRLELALELSKKGQEFIHQSEIRLLTPKLAAAYAGTTRMITRDLNVLDEMELIDRYEGGWITTRSHIIRGFLPPQAAASAARRTMKAGTAAPLTDPQTPNGPPP
jgi:Fic family protein